MNKVRSLQNIGWKHLSYDYEQLGNLPIMDQIRNIQVAYEGYEEEQQAIIDYADYQQMQNINHVKTLEMLHDLDLKYVNLLLFPKDVED